MSDVHEPTLHYDVRQPRMPEQDSDPDQDDQTPSGYEEARYETLHPQLPQVAVKNRANDAVVAVGSAAGRSLRNWRDETVHGSAGEH